MQQLGKILKAALGIYTIYVIVVVAFWYIHRVQFKGIMQSEALDARREIMDEEQLLKRITHHCETSNIDLYDADFDFEGVEEDKYHDIIVTAYYTYPLNLLFTVYPIEMELTGTANSPHTEVAE